MSADARVLDRACQAVTRQQESSEALFGARAAALSQLHTLASECAEPGWDGADAAPLDPRAIRRAEGLIRALPQDVPMPELAPEPDGAVSFDWIRSRRRLLSVSVGPGDGLPFAWLDGVDRGHGVVHFEGVSAPARLIQEIRSILGDANAGFRAA